MKAAPRRPTAKTPNVEVVVQAAAWRRRPRAKATVKKAVLVAAKVASTRPADLAIVLTDDSAIRALNRQWRGKNAPTNVLSFPAASPARGKSRAAPLYIGDIVIAYETTAREAAAEGKRFSHHLAHLAVHGFLHLLGYDHEADDEAIAMERLERRILARLSVPDPYDLRDAEA
jgi:probable rRNA maturation factor